MSLEKCWHQLDLLEEHAARETETIRSVDPDASEVRPHGNEYRAYLKLSKDLEREIMDQTGQLYQRVSLEASVTRTRLRTMTSWCWMRPVGSMRCSSDR